MLGAQSWFLAGAIPTVLVGGFVATRKRMAYQWKEEVMDTEGTIYPSVTDGDMEYLRYVAPESEVALAQTNADASSACGIALTAKENFGVAPAIHAISQEDSFVFLQEIRDWARSIGNEVDPRKVEAFSAHDVDVPESLLSKRASLDMSFYADTRIVSDHAEDIQMMKAPWGCGDRIDFAKMPSSLRYLVDRVQQQFEGLGRLRHVYIEYSPSGRQFHPPRYTKNFDGHDYVIIPFRRDGNATVVTFVPSLRSKRFAQPAHIQYHSWTNRDIDALLPTGSMLRVYGLARYDWSWAIRPGTSWFGSRLNPISTSLNPLPDIFTNTNTTSRTCSLGSITEMISSLFRKRRSTSNACAAGYPMDSAVVALHFEGPRSRQKQRSLLLHPEIWIFGQKPAPETYQKWSDDRPTEEQVRQDGIFKFIMNHYFEMLTVS